MNIVKKLTKYTMIDEEGWLNMKSNVPSWIFIQCCVLKKASGVSFGEYSIVSRRLQLAKKMAASK